MPIFIDPTEARKGTRLPQDVIDVATILPDLEAQTGADFLVSPLCVPATSPVLLRRHYEAGALVQRKTGTDLPNSIMSGHLSNSQAKMSGVCQRVWLLVVGNISNVGGQALIGGYKSIQYPSIVGALDWWQLRGGYVTDLHSDADVLSWLTWLEKALEKIANKQTKETIVRKAEQEIVIGPLAWVKTLVTIPGLGYDLSRRISEQQQSLAASLEWLLDPVRLKGNDPNKIAGIALKTFLGAREYFGLSRDWLSMRVDVPEWAIEEERWK